MSDDNSPPQSPSQRRASFAPGSKLTEMFGRTTGSNGNTFPGPIAAAAANASAHQRRRMSISTLGLSGSPNQTSPFSNRPRQESYSSTSTSPGGPDNESAIDESGDGPPVTGSSPFARRMSFGARAMRDVRGGAAGSMNGEGFNWSDQISRRASRSASIASPATAMPAPSPPNHSRANTVAAAEQPVREAPKPQSRAPDAFQERILKGDFYMD